MSVPKRIRTPGVAAIALALCITGCKEPTTGTTGKDQEARKGVVAFVGAGPGDPLWPVLQASARRQLAAGATTRVRFLNPAGNEPLDQIQLLNNLKEPNLRGVCVRLREPQTVGPALRSLQLRGLAVVSMVRPAPPELRMNHVGPDEPAIGRELARGVAEALGPAGGTIMLLHAGSDHPTYASRYLAFMDQLKIERQLVLLGEFDCDADPHQARRIIAERSARYPRLNAWVSIEDWAHENRTSTEPLMPAGMKYITCGGFPSQWPLVRDGSLPCLVAADYGAIGGRALQLCESAARDPAQSDHLIQVPALRITTGSLDEYIRGWEDWARTPAK